MKRLIILVRAVAFVAVSVVVVVDVAVETHRACTSPV